MPSNPPSYVWLNDPQWAPHGQPLAGYLRGLRDLSAPARRDLIRDLKGYRRQLGEELAAVSRLLLILEEPTAAAPRRPPQVSHPGSAITRARVIIRGLEPGTIFTKTWLKDQLITDGWEWEGHPDRKHSDIPVTSALRQMRIRDELRDAGHGRYEVPGG